MYGFPDNCSKHNGDGVTESLCPQSPGTILRVFIPKGAVINLANIVEISSPSGICLIVRSPFIGRSSHFDKIIDTIKQSGGSIEVIRQ